MVSSSEQNVFDAALELPENQRAELAERLWKSLDGGSQTQIADAWAIELRRRWDAVESGDAQLTDGATAMSEMRRKYGADKA
ncbi:MAG: putative addiction module component (TIGR02574 family) [Porticoccaceae bacterium]|jgi:putative addiction module component (TIGR02574 family)